MTQPPLRRPPLFLVTGLAFGLLLGFIVAWIIFPARVGTVGPSSLDEQGKSEYRLMIALAYASTGDLGRAQARLALLGDADPVRALASQAQLALAYADTQREARALASLAADLGAFIASAQSTGVAVNTPDPEDAAVATPFQTAPEDAVYRVRNQELLCESAATPPLIKVFVFDSNGNAQAGVRLNVTYDGGADEFFTGAWPENGPGYAQYEMTPGVVYALSVNGAQMLGGLQPAACETDAGEPAWGAWLVLFETVE